ncbi:retrovirus-related pol polyprotein from transposon TNT 1-94 [Tanacetum coccineum]
MTTLAEFIIVAGADNRPPMLDKPMYESWKSRMELYIQGKDHGQIILNSVENGPLIWPTVELEDDTDIVKLLMQGTSLSKQECECKLYDEFDKFSHVKARDLHTSNYDQLYADLEQHEAHANEARLMHERFPDLLALVANYHQPQSHFNNYRSQYTTPYHTQPFVTQNSYPLLTIPQQPQVEFPQIDSGLAVPIFLPGDDPIACMNKAMAFLSAVFSPRYPSINNNLRFSSNPRNQATIQDGRVTVQQVLGRQAKAVLMTNLSSCDLDVLSEIAKIMGYSDYQIRNVTISRVYYVEGLGHNLFSFGQFCDSDLEVAFRKHTCFVRTLEGVDLLSGSRGTNLYTLSIGDMIKSSPICLLSKAFKTKKTPYEFLHDRKPDLSYLYVFGALCYPTNDSEDVGKLKVNTDVGIFIRYAPTKKAYRIYNRRTRRIMETIHVDFDELITMDSEQSSTGPTLL